jgi:probable LLM family oxidoreductase
MSRIVEFGLDTFGDVTLGPSGRSISHAQVIRNLIDEAALADELGIDSFGVGEHHRADFAVSCPEVVLAAIAARTDRIRLGSAATVLGADDPVRVFERFATLNALSNGRAEVMLGRGWFTEPFPLFGFELSDYGTLFEEKLDLFAALTRKEVVSWRGKLRAPLTNQRLFPPLENGSLKTWIAVGETPESVLRAARYDLPMMLAIIGGEPTRFKPLVDLYRLAFERLGRPMQAVGVDSAGYVAETDDKARDEFWPHYKPMRDRIGAERGWPPLERAKFDVEVDRGSLYVGSPETVARKIAATVKGLELSRFNIRYSVGTLPHEKLLRSIELYGTRVIPLAREILS